MKRTLIFSMATLLLAAAMLSQSTEDLRGVRADMMGALTGDIERFERGMRAVEALLEKNPKDPAILVMHGNGMMVRAGEGFRKGDMANAAKAWQSGLDEMARAVELAPESLLVRARRGVFMLTASRQAPPQIGKPLLELGVGDFEKVLEIRDREKSFAAGSLHKRGELLTGLADGWNRMGNVEKARAYFERVLKDMKGTVYEQKAKAWLEDKPEAKVPEFFACTGCHVD
jgi:hypothetical protein